MRCILNCHLLTILAHAEADSSLMFLLVGRGFRDLVRSGCNLGHNELISGKPRTRISEECGAIAGDFSDFRLSLHGGGEWGVRLTTAYKRPNYKDLYGNLSSCYRRAELNSKIINTLEYI